MSRLLLILFFCATRQASFCQYVDSLLLQLDSTRRDTVQVDLNFNIGTQYNSSSLGTAYLKRSIAICREISGSAEPSVRAYAQRVFPSLLSALAWNYEAREYRLEALNLYREAATLFEQRADSEAIIATQNQMGLLFQNAGDRKGAMSYYRSALVMALSMDHPWWPASLRARMARLFVEEGALDSADIYLSESLKDRISSPVHYRFRNLALLRRRKAIYRQLLHGSIQVCQKADA